jgi:hypothetical protein
MRVFIDETGDHNLEIIDSTYPLFGLGALLIADEKYAAFEKSVLALKKLYFAEPETFILHSSELKRPTKSRSDPRNKIMLDPVVRAAFYEEVFVRCIEPHGVRFIVCFVRKQQMAASYYNPENPYYFAFENALNRILRSSVDHVAMVAEARSPELDTELRAQYDRLCRTGTPFYTPEMITSRTSLQSVPKIENIAGLQIVDLALSSFARAALAKQDKMQGNDIDPAALHRLLAQPITYFPKP